MKRTIFILFVISLLYRITIPAAFAHELETDGTIGAVMHIEPNDDPVANSQSSFFFEIKDTTNKFTPNACTCTFTISENGKTLYSSDLYQRVANGQLAPTAQFTFPQKDKYTVQIMGKPQTSGAFQPFTLSYDVMVNKDTTESSTVTTRSGFLATHGMQLVFGGGIVLVLILLGVINKVKKW